MKLKMILLLSVWLESRILLEMESEKQSKHATELELQWEWLQAIIKILLLLLLNKLVFFLKIMNLILKKLTQLWWRVKFLESLLEVLSPKDKDKKLFKLSEICKTLLRSPIISVFWLDPLPMTNIWWPLVSNNSVMSLPWLVMELMMLLHLKKPTLVLLWVLLELKLPNKHQELSCLMIILVQLWQQWNGVEIFSIALENSYNSSWR